MCGKNNSQNVADGLPQETINNKLAKFVGVCNSIDSALVKCLKKERVARSAANRTKARQRQAELQERMNTSSR